jgi:serine/threonine protein kinase
VRSAPTAPSIAGHQFVRLISGRGGFGDVYLYRELALDRDVAIKVIRDPSLDANSRAKFEAEAKAMAALEHPNVVRIYAIGQTGEGHPYISMMFCPSPTMAERSVGGRLPLHDVLTIGVVVASAVESAHRAGVIHRDLKPANILTMPGGAPGLTDFGVAASLEADADDDDAGVSIPWSPPEMLFTMTRGSRATDVYSLTATIWHLLVGRSPFEVLSGDNTRMSLMTRIRDAAPPPTGRADVPASLERILRRGLAKEPAMRPQTAAELGRSLQAVQNELRLSVSPFVVLENSGGQPLGPILEPTTTADSTRRRRAPQDGPAASSSSEIIHVDPIGRTGDNTSGRIKPGDLEGITGKSRPRSRPAGSPDRTVGTGTLVAGAALITAAALGLGYVAFGRGSGSEPRGRSTTTAGSDQGIPPAPGRPRVTWEKQGSKNHFVWDYDYGDPGDSYRWTLTTTSGTGPPETTTGTSADPVLNVPWVKGRLVCLTVEVVPADLRAVPQAGSAPVCSE